MSRHVVGNVPKKKSQVTLKKAEKLLRSAGGLYTDLRGVKLQSFKSFKVHLRTGHEDPEGE